MTYYDHATALALKVCGWGTTDPAQKHTAEGRARAADLVDDRNETSQPEPHRKSHRPIARFTLFWPSYFVK